MIEIYESLLEEEKDGETTSSFKEVAKKDATYVHKCYHDEAGPDGQCRPCKREVKK